MGTRTLSVLVLLFIVECLQHKFRRCCEWVHFFICQINHLVHLFCCFIKILHTFQLNSIRKCTCPDLSEKINMIFSYSDILVWAPKIIPTIAQTFFLKRLSLPPHRPRNIILLFPRGIWCVNSRWLKYFQMHLIHNTLL